MTENGSVAPNDTSSTLQRKIVSIRLDFVEALTIVKSGLERWKLKPHNAKWWKIIDGTPIPNDLCVNIAEVLAEREAPPAPTPREGMDTRYENLKLMAQTLEEMLNEIQEICVEAKVGLNSVGEPCGKLVDAVRELAGRAAGQTSGDAPPKFATYENWIASLPKCLPWDQCDGDLPGEPHADNCPMKDKEPATFRDAFEAGRAALGQTSTREHTRGETR
jgi:hypothetical protein